MSTKAKRARDRATHGLSGRLPGVDRVLAHRTRVRWVAIVVATIAAALEASCATTAPRTPTAAAEQRRRAAAQLESRYAPACARLAEPPSTLLEQRIKQPDKYTSEWLKANHPELPNGSLTKQVIRKTIQSHIEQVRSCFQQGADAEPDLAGRVTIRFGITAEGAVGAVAIAANSTQNEYVGCCIAEQLERWRFPSPEGGGFVIVTYPFVLDLAR